jgi:hypothetical protein
MEEIKNYKYEVAFSFLQGDETIALQINDLIQDRISTFLYSKKQEELGGSDGEKKFNEVFYNESRIVVVLYRNGWGQTPWTRIEETAIRNRAFDSGWEFLVIVNLDKASNLPNWIPKIYIWVDYERWKSEGVAPVIEQKVKENGGHARPESLEDKAKRFGRLRASVKKRELFFNNGEAQTSSDNEVVKMIELLKDNKAKIEDPDTYFKFSTEEREREMYQFGNNGYNLCFNWFHQYHEIKDRSLIVTIYEKLGHHGIDYKFDRDLEENNIWKPESNIWAVKNKYFTSTELVDYWVSMFIDVLVKREKNRR